MRAVTDHIDVVVLAGGINCIELFEGYTPGYKALLPLCGRPVISYTLDAIRAVPQVRRVCIVGPQAELEAALAHKLRNLEYSILPGGETLLGSIVTGLQYFDDVPFVLVVMADAPLINPQAVTDFLCRCSRCETPYEVCLWLPAVPRQYFEGAYQNVQKPFNCYRGLTTGYGNFAVVTPRLIQHPVVTAAINPIYRARKSPFSLVTVGGNVSLVYFTYLVGAHLLRLLTQEQVFRFASRCFGLGMIPVEVPYPGIVIDMDDPADYDFIMEQLQEELTMRLESPKDERGCAGGW